MLTIQQITHLKASCFSLERQLSQYKQPSPMPYFLEAKYTLYSVSQILKEGDKKAMESQLKHLLFTRWDRIKSQDVQYCHDFNNPANILCIEIAQALENPPRNTYLGLLMPTLTKTSIDSYITSSWAEETLNLKEVILSDDNERLINIPDVLDFAFDDGVLKHNSMFMNKKKELSFGEKNRLFARHPSVDNYFQAIQDKVNFMLHGETAGAYLSRLICGLRDGGKHKGGTESDSGEDANVAIIEFDLFLKWLPEEKRTIVLNAQKVDRVRSRDIECLSIRSCWEILTRPNDRTVTDVEAMPVNFCVELIAGHLEEILKENPELYQLIHFEEIHVTSIEELNNRVETSRLEMLEALRASTRHCCYGSALDNQFANKVLRTIPKNHNMALAVDEIVYIATHYNKLKQIQAGGNQYLLETCKKILISVNSRYKRKIINQALAAMPDDVADQFATLVSERASASISPLNTHLFFNDSKPAKKQRSDRNPVAVSAASNTIS